MWPQLIGCALAQEPVHNFGLRVANNGGRRICGDKKVIGLCFSQLQTEVYLQKPLGLYMDRRQTTMELGTKVEVKGNVLV